jgi:uncharacterized membrane protein
MWTKKSNLETIVTLIVILFIWTGLSKYIDNTQFKNALNKSPLISNYSNLISFVLPGLELATAILLIVPRLRLTGLYISSGLLILFTFYLLVILRSYKNLPCTCGGVISKLSWIQHVYFNIFFLILSLVGTYLARVIYHESYLRAK